MLVGLCGLVLAGGARAEVIGPALVNRSSMDGAANYLFMHDDGTPGFTKTGTVTSWFFFNDNGTAQGGRTIEPLLMKRSGTNWVVTGVGQTLTTPATMSGVQTYPFVLASGSNVVGPDYTFAHHDLNNGGSIEADWPGGNTWTHRYIARSGSKEILGTTLADASFSTRSRVYSIEFATREDPMFTVGNALINRASEDGANGGLFMLTKTFSGGGHLIEWAYYDNDAYSPDRQITPLILENVAGNYLIRGIGTTRTTTEQGEQHWLFNLTAGSDLIGPGYYFAWKDGTPLADNAGVIDWDANALGTGMRYFGTGHAGNLPLDRNLGAGTLYGRDYSLQVTMVTPEPATFGLLALGGLALARRRRRTGER
jgi:hypothetical protein